jgi:hypothetical protein
MPARRITAIIFFFKKNGEHQPRAGWLADQNSQTTLNKNIIWFGVFNHENEEKMTVR